MKTEADFDRLLDLAKDWNSYEADPIDKRAVEAAKRLLNPAIVPTTRSGVSIEYRWPSGEELYIEFRDDGSIESFAFERGSNT